MAKIKDDEIVKKRLEYAEDNFVYIVGKMFAIPEVKQEVSKKKREHIPESEFYGEDTQNI